MRTRCIPIGAVGVVISLAFLVGTLEAQTHTWDGGSATTNNWSDAANWDAAGAPLQPGSGLATIIFGGSTRLTPVVQAPYDVNSVTFNSTAGLFQIGGSGPLTIRGGGVTNNDNEQQRLVVPLVLGASQTWNAAAGDMSYSSVTFNGNQLTLDGANDHFFGSPVTGPTGSIIKNGAGNVMFSGNSSSLAAFTLNAGTLQLNSATGTLGTAAVTINGGSVEAATLARTIANTLTIGGDFSTVGSQNLTLSGAATLTGDRTITAATTGATTTTLSGAISEDAAGRGLTKTGAGTLTFSGSAANTYSGATTVNAGTLILNKTGVNAVAGNLTIGDGIGGAAADIVQLGSSHQIADTATVTVNSSGRLDLNNLFETIDALSLGGGSVTTGFGRLTLGSTLTASAGSPATSTVSGALFLGGLRSFNVGDGTGVIDLEIPAIISGSIGSIEFVGSGGVTRLTGANTFAGGVTLNSGHTLMIGNNQALGVGGTFTVNGGTIQATGVAMPIVANPITLNSDLIVGGSGPLSLTGGVTLTGDRALNVTGTGVAFFFGRIQESGGSRSLTKNGPGTLSVGGDFPNTYTGTTTVNDGILQLGKTSGVTAVPGNLFIGDAVGVPQSARVVQTSANQIADASSVTIRADGLWDLGGNNETINSLSMTGSTVTTGAGTLTLTNLFTATSAAGGPASITGNLDLGGGVREFRVSNGPGFPDARIDAAIANGGLTKTDTGALVLGGSAANTYTGVTTVNSGILRLEKSVANGAILGDLVIGNGTALLDEVEIAAPNQIANTANVTVNAGGILEVIDDEDGIGRLTLNGGTVMFQVAAGPPAQQGALTLLGDVTVNQSSSIDSAASAVGLRLGDVARTFTVADDPLTLDDLVVTARITNGFLIKAGPGRMVMNGSVANANLGTTTVNEGTLDLAKTANTRSIGVDLVIGDGLGGSDADVVTVSANGQIGPTSVTINSSGLLSLGPVTETIGSLTLNGGHITGAPGSLLRLAGSMTVNASSNTAVISAPLDLLGVARVFAVNNGTPTVDLDVTEAINNGVVFKSGAGTLRFSGTATNTINRLGIDDGTLLLARASGSSASSGFITVGDGAGAPGSAVIRLEGAGEQINDMVGIGLAPDGLFDIAGFSETIAQLQLAGGAVTTGAGFLRPTTGIRSFSSPLTASIVGNLDLGGAVQTIDVQEGTANPDLSISATILVSPGGGWIKAGDGRLQLTSSTTIAYPITLNAGTLDAPMTLAPAGSFTQNGGTFVGTLTNQGTFAYNAGTFSGQLINESTGAVNFNGDFTAGNGLTNNGTINIAAGRMVTVSGAGLANNGAIQLSGGTLNATSSSNYASNGVISGFGTIASANVSFINAATGQINVSGGHLVFNSNVSPVNAGRIDVPSGLELRLVGSGGMQNSGLITLSGGKITGGGGLANNLGGEIRGGSSIEVPLINAGGVIRATNNGVLTVTNLLSNTAGGELRADEGATLNITNSFTNSALVVLNGPNAAVSGGAINNAGAATIRGQGRITNVLANAGVIRAENGTLTLAAVGNTNTGRIEAGTGTQVLFSQGLTSNAGQIALSGGALDNNNVALTNPGLIAGYGTLRTGGLTNAGTISVGGSLDVLGPVTNNNVVSTQLGSTARFFGPVNGPGSYPGAGTVMFLNTFSPGASPAIVNFGGDLVLTRATSLVMELGGATPGAQHDQLAIAGSATLAGTLDIDLINGFVPGASQDFVLATYSSRTGTFESVEFSPLSAGLTWSLDYGLTNLTLSVTSSRLPGDIDQDGDVDRTDAALFSQFFGRETSSIWTTSDFDGDAATTLLDMGILQAHFGATVASPSAAAVPEPASVMLTVVVLVALFLKRVARGALAPKVPRGVTFTRRLR